MSNMTASARIARRPCSPSLLGNCSALDRLKNIGEQPALSAIENPTAQPGYKPVQMPMPAPQPAVYNPNSLWRNGSRAFFKDQRAHAGRRHPDREGEDHRQRQDRERHAAQPNQQGRFRHHATSSAARLLPQATPILPGKILTADSTASSEGKGSVNRQEALLTNVAAVVTQVLPNGNLVVEGKQEVRVNFEIRELIVAGIVRPEDIESDNTIDFDQDRAGAHRLWRPRPDHRRAAAALRPAGDGCAAAVLSSA